MLGGAVTSLTPVLYVGDLAAAKGFYALLGFEELFTGDEGGGGWAYLRCGELNLLLAIGGEGDGTADRGQVQLYCQTDDLSAVHQRLAAAQARFEHLGNPPHAPGGEIRVLDPDGHAVMVAQTAGAARDEQEQEPDNRLGVLHRAVEAAKQRGGEHESICHVGTFGGGRCHEEAEVKLVDSWGDSAWSCLPHAEEVLFNVNSAFVASSESEGVTAYLARRRRAQPRHRGDGGVPDVPAPRTADTDAGAGFSPAPPPAADR